MREKNEKGMERKENNEAKKSKAIRNLHRMTKKGQGQ